MLWNVGNNRRGQSASDKFLVAQQKTIKRKWALESRPVGEKKNQALRINFMICRSYNFIAGHSRVCQVAQWGQRGVERGRKEHSKD